MKEEKVLVTGSLMVENFREVSDLKKIEEITDRFGNPVFNVDTQSGVISVHVEQTGKKAYQYCFWEPYHRLHMVSDPVRVECEKHRSTYNNRIPSPILSAKLHFSGELYITLERNNKISHTIFQIKDNKLHAIDEDSKSNEDSQKKGFLYSILGDQPLWAKVLFCVGAIALMPLWVPVLLIMEICDPIMKKIDAYKYKKAKERMYSTKA